MSIRRVTVVRGEVYEQTDVISPRDERAVHFVMVEPMKQHATVTLSGGKKFDVPWDLINEVHEVAAEQEIK